MPIAGLHRVGPTFFIADVDENDVRVEVLPISDHDRSASRAHFAHPTSPADRSRTGEVLAVEAAWGQRIITVIVQTRLALFSHVRSRSRHSIGRGPVLSQSHRAADNHDAARRPVRW